MINLINNNWRNIARGFDSLLILGGQSADEYDQNNLNELKKKYFTVTANMVIKKHNYVDMYITADNVIVKQMFESKPYVTLKHQEVFINNQIMNLVIGGEITVPDNLYMIPSLIKVVICQNLFPLNNVFATGQLYLDFLDNYSGYPNLYGMVEHRTISENGLSKDIFGYEGKLITDDTFSSREYGNLIESTKHGESLKIYSGGNVASDILQLLWFMGFDNVYVIGWGDIGITTGYNDGRIFEWTDVEIKSLNIHKQMWGDRIKILSGGELLNKHANIQRIPYEELINKSQNKKELTDKLYGIKT